MEIRENERIDELGFGGYRIIQNTTGFCFGMDAVLLGNYAKVKKNARVVDLGTGTGIIPLIVNGKNSVDKIYGIEIQEIVADMAARSVELNNLSDKIEILNIDLKDAEERLGVNQYDVVTSNPPYMSESEGLKNESQAKRISRHEVKCSLEDVIRVASRLLRHNGKFYMVHRPNRLVDIMVLLRQYKLEPKKMRFVHPKVGKSPNLILIESIKASKPDLKMGEPLYVYRDDGEYTDEIYDIYGLDKKQEMER